MTGGGDDGGREEELSRKRKRQICEDEALARSLQEEEERAVELERVRRSFSSGSTQGDRMVAESSLPAEPEKPRVSELSSTFRLMRVANLPGWANAGCVTVGDVIQGDIQVALISNYMVDVQWLLSACPLLKEIPRVVIFHGEGGGSLDHLKAHKPAHWLLYKPPLRISYGTHHSKAMFLIYRTGVRIIIHTANLIHVDWNNKSQGLWMQDFPVKSKAASKESSVFEDDLVEYLTALEWTGCKASIPGQGDVQVTAAYFRRFDFTDASVRLVASVPGYHNGRNLTKWGHMKLRTMLANERFDDEFIGSPVVYQFSSLGSLDEKWMSEFSASVCAGTTQEKQPLGPGSVQIIWPTVENVRWSLEGYAAGNALPSPLKNIQKSFLSRYWARWQAEHSGRSRAMPHIKTFVRYRGQSIAWLLLTSSNLSKAAWGALQKNSSQLMIRSYELGVCFVPSLAHKQNVHPFSCTDNKNPAPGPELKADPATSSGKDAGLRSVKFVTSQWSGEVQESTHLIRFPLPYSIPPSDYDAEEDMPWSWDRSCPAPDVYGQGWPRHVQLYTE